MASTSATPISPARFAEALKDLPISSLHLKAAELRNSIAHLDYSNEQLKPFAEGRDPSQIPENSTGATYSSGGEELRTGAPDQDCIDAIKENEIVIRRIEERILLLKTEVEGRGLSWTEFGTSGAAEDGATEGKDRNVDVDTDMAGQGGLVNGTGSSTADGHEEGRSSAWTDGTFQTGRIVNGEVRMDGVGSGGSEGVGQGVTSTASRTNGTGGRLDDEALRRAMEEQMRNLGHEDDDDEAGMHL